MYKYSMYDMVFCNKVLMNRRGTYIHLVTGAILYHMTSVYSLLIVGGRKRVLFWPRSIMPQSVNHARITVIYMRDCL